MQFGLLLYTDVEPMDLATVGVISMARRIIPELSYVTLSREASPVTLSNGLRILPDFALDNAPQVDVLIVPGGPGWPAASDDPLLQSYLQKVAANRPIASVCTGAMLLASAGLLADKTATTKVETVPPEESPLNVLSDRYPDVTATRALIVDEGRINNRRWSITMYRHDALPDWSAILAPPRQPKLHASLNTNRRTQQTAADLKS